MNVLVATDDLTFSVSLSQAYKAAGHAVSAGIAELYLDLHGFDLIHFHWPEELTQWQVPPLRPLVDRVLARLDALKPSAKMVCTVHNLVPHADDSSLSHAYYARFYDRMDRIGHFSQSSLDAVRARFPQIPGDRHFIHGMNDFANLKVHARGQATARASLGISDDRRVVAAIGQLRSMDELDLLSQGLGKAALRHWHFLQAFRPPGAATLVSRARRRMMLRRFSRMPVTPSEGYIEDPDLVAICEAADFVVVPRMGNQLNSGVLPLAMTFGTGLVAPDCGVFREVLGGSMNELFEPGDAAAMAGAIVRMASRDPASVRADNLARSADWGWSHAIPRIMAALA